MIETLSIQEQLHHQWLALFLSLGLGILTFTLALRLGLFKSFQVSELPVIRGKDVLKGFSLYIVGTIIAPFLITIPLFIIYGKTLVHYLSFSWLNLGSTLIGASFVFLAYLSLTQEQRHSFWSQTSKKWYRDFFIGVFAGIVIYPIAVAVNQLLTLSMWYLFEYLIVEQDVLKYLRNIDNSALFFITAFLIVVVVPITEEFLFRGLLQSWLKNKIHRPFLSIGITSLIFSAFHYTNSQGLTNIVLLPTLFILSCMLGFIYERQRSLWAPIGLHCFVNFLGVLMIFKE